MSRHVRGKSRNSTIPETKERVVKKLTVTNASEDKKKLFFGLSN